VGLVSFSSAAQTLQSPTTDRDAVRRALDGLRPQGATATGDAILASLRALRPRRSDRTPAAIVLLSDGKETKGANSLEAAVEARELGVKVYTVALGTATGSIEVRRRNGTGTRRQAVPPDPATLREIARRSGGRFFAAPDARDLATVYERLGSSAVSVRERQQVTAGFAGGALALLLVGAALSAVWTGRLP
jgi:Ca-activated chloride channel family protein